jgi:hypothetical protein
MIYLTGKVAVYVPRVGKDLRIASLHFYLSVYELGKGRGMNTSALPFISTALTRDTY